MSVSSTNNVVMKKDAGMHVRKRNLFKVSRTLTNHFVQLLSVTLNVLPLYKDWISSVLQCPIFWVYEITLRTQSGKIKRTHHHALVSSVKWGSNLFFRATFQTNRQWVIDNSKDRFSIKSSKESKLFYGLGAGGQKNLSKDKDKDGIMRHHVILELCDSRGLMGFCKPSRIIDMWLVLLTHREDRFILIQGGLTADCATNTLIQLFPWKLSD